MDNRHIVQNFTSGTLIFQTLPEYSKEYEMQAKNIDLTRIVLKTDVVRNVDDVPYTVSLGIASIDSGVRDMTLYNVILLFS